MSNNEVIEDNLIDVYSGLEQKHIIERMKNLDFICLFNKEVTSKYSKPNQIYLFMNEKIGLCEISTYEDKVSTINLIVNLDFKDKIKGFDLNFSHAKWSVSTGTPSGYGHSIKVGKLTVKSIKKSLEEINDKARFIFPFFQSTFFECGSFFSENELITIPECKDINHSTNWFISNKIKKQHQHFFNDVSITDRNPFSYWDDHIRWSYKNLEKFPKKDKNFYYICKKIFTENIDSIELLLDKNFIYYTSSLGHNICHLMSMIQNPEKKNLLWNHFQNIPNDIQSEFINQNDLAGYNPILLLAHHSNIRTVTDQSLNIDFFEKYLSIKGIEKSFFNEKNSLLDCLFYGTGDLRKNAAEYIKKINEANLEIPLIYLNKKDPFSSTQKVTDIFKDDEIKYKLRDEAYNLIIKSNLNLKLRDSLSVKENIVKTKKI